MRDVGGKGHKGHTKRGQTPWKARPHGRPDPMKDHRVRRSTELGGGSDVQPS
jgi:hypothetical protein